MELMCLAECVAASAVAWRWQILNNMSLTSVCKVVSDSS